MDTEPWNRIAQFLKSPNYGPDLFTITLHPELKSTVAHIPSAETLTKPRIVRILEWPHLIDGYLLGKKLRVVYGMNLFLGSYKGLAFRQTGQKSPSLLKQWACEPITTLSLMGSLDLEEIINPGDFLVLPKSPTLYHPATDSLYRDTA